MNIFTLTLNPAFDIHAYTDVFTAEAENLITITSKDSGGKGVNISTALDNSNVKNTSIIVLGEDNSDEFIKNLSLSDPLLFYKKGRIRENLTIHTKTKETRISYEGFTLSDDIFEEILSTVKINENDIFTFTGSVPKGISKNSIIKFLKSLKNYGARLVIDSKSITLSDLYSLSPWLIKPNEEEISAYFNEEIHTLDQAAEYALTMHNKGIENVIISLGEKGAVLATDGNHYKVVPPKISVKSTVGAGDSSIAGFIYAKTKCFSNLEKLKFAVSFGSAACKTAGTTPPKFSDITEIYNAIK